MLVAAIDSVPEGAEFGDCAFRTLALHGRLGHRGSHRIGARAPCSEGASGSCGSAVCSLVVVVVRVGVVLLVLVGWVLLWVLLWVLRMLCVGARGDLVLMCMLRGVLMVLHELLLLLVPLWVCTTLGVRSASRNRIPRALQPRCIHHRRWRLASHRGLRGGVHLVKILQSQMCNHCLY